ncbi:hypothetical protein [Burkholderia ubonensis]|uniref:hypothetical protein n=1 Tax=Burkholderia ubonensis TaxID=101571 RepID=UPI000B200413|nr:hypothetical protein [Burkholderia ubonensis]
MSAAARQPAYAPRNALNADALKAAIAARSRARGDDDTVRAWLLNHFLRHVVANFEPARPIASLDDARRALGQATPPAWVAARFGAAAKARGDAAARELAPVVWVDPADPQLLALEAKLVEFLTSRKGTALDGKLDRINCPQALALWEKEHGEMAARIAHGWRVSQPDALRAWLDTRNGRFVEFLPDSALLRDEMAFESYVMRHCLGQFADRHALTGGYGERYAEAIEARRLRLLSFRDSNGQPHITISAIVRADGRLDIDQVKGKQNRPPIERYVDDVLACLNALGTSDETPPDCVAIGVVGTPSGWRRIEDVTDAASQARLVARHPQLFRRLAAPTPTVEWLVAGRQPELLSARPPRAASVRYAVRAVLAPAASASAAAAAARPADPPVAYATEGVRWPGCDASHVAADARA